MKFGTALRRERLKAKLAQREVAARAGVAQPTIANWETGRHVPCRPSFLMLVDVFPALGRRFEADIFPQFDNKPAGNPLGNPGKRSAETRANMSAASAARIAHRVSRDGGAGEVLCVPRLDQAARQLKVAAAKLRKAEQLVARAFPHDDLIEYAARLVFEKAFGHLVKK